MKKGHFNGLMVQKSPFNGFNGPVGHPGILPKEDRSLSLTQKLWPGWPITTIPKWIKESHTQSSLYIGGDWYFYSQKS